MIHVHAFTLKYGCDVEYGNLVRLQKQPQALLVSTLKAKYYNFLGKMLPGNLMKISILCICNQFSDDKIMTMAEW